MESFIVKPSKKNIDLLRKRGILHSDEAILKGIARDIARKRYCKLYFESKEEYEYNKQVLERVGLEVKRD